MHTSFNFILGEDEDDAQKRWQISDVSPCPLVGEKVSLHSTRDENGNYVYKAPEMLFDGVVTRIEHFIEERGQDAAHNQKIHFVNVYMKPFNPYG